MPYELIDRLMDVHACFNTFISYNQRPGEKMLQLMQDKLIKVWDIRNFRCLQSLCDKTVYHPDDVIGAVLFDSERSQMVSANQSLMRWPMEVLEGSGVHGHASPVIQVLFNALFDDAISGDQSGTVCVWNVNTGRLRFRCNAPASRAGVFKF
jgi:WD40 repeat protein